MVPPCVATALVDEVHGEPRTRIAESHIARTQGEVGPGRGRSKGLSMTQSMFMGSSSASAFPALVWQVFAIADGGDRDAAMLSEPLGLGSMDAAAIVPASALGDAGLMLGDILSTDIETAQRVGFFFRVVHAKPSALKQTGDCRRSGLGPANLRSQRTLCGTSIANPGLAPSLWTHLFCRRPPSRRCCGSRRSASRRRSGIAWWRSGTLVVMSRLTSRRAWATLTRQWYAKHAAASSQPRRSQPSRTLQQ